MSEDPAAPTTTASPAARRAAMALAASRAAYGATLVLAPGVTALTWLGPREARRPATHVLARAFGAREVLCGLGALHVLGRGSAPARRGTMAALACADLVDLTATLGRRRRLAGPPAVVSIAGAAGSVAVGAWAAVAG